MRPNSPPQTTSVDVEQAARLEVREQAGDRLVDGAGVVLVAVLEVAVLVPAVGADARAEQLDEPDAPLDQPPGDQAFAGEDLRRRIGIVEAVEPPGRRRLAVEAHQLGDGRLHPEGQLVVGDRRFQAVVAAHPAQHALVERAQQLELARAGARRVGSVGAMFATGAAAGLKTDP